MTLPRAVPLLLAIACLAAPAAGAPDGQAVYKNKCSFCHGVDGTPNSFFAKKNVRDFKDAAWQKEQTDEAIAKAIREGTEGTLMRTFEKELTAEEIEALVGFIRGLGPKKKE